MADEKRLVSMEYALEQLKMAEAECGGNFETDSSHVKDFLKALPVVEAAPVKHGQWLYGDVTGNVFLSEIYCPWCGKPALYPDDEDRPLETPYCPHCGAIMDATKPDPSWPFYDASLKEKKKRQK